MRTDDYQYRLNQLRRDEVMWEARRQQLVQSALERRPKTKRAYVAALMTLWHSLFRSSYFIVGLFLTLLLISSFGTDAQAMRDPGITEPYHPSFVYYRVGVYFVLRGNYERALHEFTRAIDGLPQFASAYAARGDVYRALEDYERAIADYTSAIDFFPNFVSVLYTRGRAYHAIGEVTLAIADYANAIEQLPEYALPYWGLGDLYFEQGRYADALEHYHLYIALVDNPDQQVIARIEELEILAVVEAI